MIRLTFGAFEIPSQTLINIDKQCVKLFSNVIILFDNVTGLQINHYNSRKSVFHAKYIRQHI